jgi:hypothetical protein
MPRVLEEGVGLVHFDALPGSHPRLSVFRGQRVLFLRQRVVQYNTQRSLSQPYQGWIPQGPQVHGGVVIAISENDNGSEGTLTAKAGLLCLISPG